jgi:YHS domain-containing protein
MKQFLFLFAAISLFLNAAAQTEARKKQFNISKSSLAIDGYDPVAYFTQNKAVKGNKSYAVAHDGITYYFSSAENKQAFIAKPSSYEPQYGGWCAYAMGNSGEKVEIDPETFKITGGKLYLFYNKYFNNTLKSWNKNEASLKTNADNNWAKIYR